MDKFLTVDEKDWNNTRAKLGSIEIRKVDCFIFPEGDLYCSCRRIEVKFAIEQVYLGIFELKFRFASLFVRN